MPENEAADQLRALEAVASERGMLLAFRVCEEADELEPVFVRAMCTNSGSEREASLLAIADARGMSLGRFVFPRAQLERALAEAPDFEAEDDGPVVVPVDWSPESV